MQQKVCVTVSRLELEVGLSWTIELKKTLVALFFETGYVIQVALKPQV